MMEGGAGFRGDRPARRRTLAAAVPSPMRPAGACIAVWARNPW